MNGDNLENNAKDIANSIGKLLTPEDISSLLSISPRTVYDYAQKGKIPAIKMLGQWRFKESDIVDWIENLQSKGGNDFESNFTSSDQLAREQFDDATKHIMKELEQSKEDKIAVKALSFERKIPDEIVKRVIEKLKKDRKIEIYKHGKEKIETIKKRG